MQDTLTLPVRDRDHERVLGIIFDISPSQASVLSCLSRATLVSSQELLDYTDVSSLIKVVVSRTRSKLRAHGMDICSKQEVGYWITPEDKHTIERMVQKFMDGR